MDVVNTLPLEKKKRGRGRPPNKKNLELTAIIGESTFPILINTPTKQSASKLSEETAKKGFVSTPTMKLSPSKTKNSANSNTIISKSVLQNITNSPTACLSSSPIDLLKRTHDEVISINQYDYTNNKRKNDDNDDDNNTTTKTKFIADIMFSSPVSSVGGVMTSEPNYEPSSPFNTSPIPSDNYKSIQVEEEEDGVQNKLKEEEILQSKRSIVNNLQSSPYDEQFIKYINSLPVQTFNIIKDKNHTKKQDGLEIPKHSKIEKLNKCYTHNKSQKINLLNYRFNYQYKLTLNVNDYGKAKIFARVLEREFPEYKDCGYNYNYNYNDVDSYDYNYDYTKEEQQYCDIIPNRYEQYIEKVHQQRKAIVQSCMKNDVFFTGQYYPYLNSGITNTNTNINSALPTTKTSSLREPFRTVNINHIMNKGLSAGLCHPYSTDFHPLEETKTVAATNDARVALREVLLRSSGENVWAE